VPGKPKKLLEGLQALNKLNEGSDPAELPPALAELNAKLRANVDALMQKLPTSVMGKMMGGGGGDIAAGVQGLLNGDPSGITELLQAVAASRTAPVGMLAVDAMLSSLDLFKTGGGGDLRQRLEQQVSKLEGAIKQEVDAQVSKISGSASTAVQLASGVVNAASLCFHRQNFVSKWLTSVWLVRWATG
jgi:hypothetical protein